MHCPNCGVKATPNQKFCRGCGLGLEKFSDLMTDTIGTEDRRSIIDIVGKFSGAAFLAGCSMIVLYLLYAIIRELIDFKGHVFIPLAMLLFFIGGILFLAYIYYTESQKEKNKQKRVDLQPESSNAETTKKLSQPDYSNFISNITERTTGLLEVKEVQIAKEKRSGEF
jgi:hypothetical protein